MTGNEEGNENSTRSPVSSTEESHDVQEDQENEDIPLRYGPMPTFRNQREWTRFVLMIGTVVIVYFTTNPPQMIILAKQKDLLDYRRQNVPCSEKYITEVSTLSESCKLDQCGISVRDKVITEELVDSLLAIMNKVYDNSNKGVFHPYFLHLNVLNSSNLLNKEESYSLSAVKRIIQDTVGPPEAELDLTEPSFFARLSNSGPQPPPDKCILCHFNAVLYFNDYKFGVEGGRSMFLQPDNSTIVVEPRKGRLVSWWGGSHWKTEAIKTGVLFCLRLSFSCSAFQPSLTRSPAF